MLYKESLTAHQWTPPVADNLKYIQQERQWLLLGSKLAFLHIYIACQTTRNNDFEQWNEDLFNLVTQEAILLRRQGMCCLAMGDFNTRVGEIPGLEGNTPDTNKNLPMFMNLVSQVNMTIINTLPISKGLFTRFMDNSGSKGSMSLLDYGLVDNDNVSNVTSFVIDEDARFSCGSDHALLEVEIDVGEVPRVHWAFHDAIHYNITDNTNYSKYIESMETAITSIPLHTFSKMPLTEMLPHISENINTSAKNTLGLKVKKVKTGRKLPLKIIKMIREKNALSAELYSVNENLPSSQAEEMIQHLDQLKFDIKDAVAGVKIDQRRKLRSRLLLADPTRKRFWRFLKSQIKSAGSITAVCNKSNNMVFEQGEIENAVLDHFTDIFKAQRVPVFDSNKHSTCQTDLAIADIDKLLQGTTIAFEPSTFEEQVCPPFTFNELEEELRNLANGKASSYDAVPNELLKNSGFQFRLYLMTFLNRILEDGGVPPDLNIGKCMLIHKVGL